MTTSFSTTRFCRPLSLAAGWIALAAAAGCSSSPGGGAAGDSPFSAPQAEHVATTQSAIQTAPPAADAGAAAQPEVNEVDFEFHPNPKFTSCFAQYPDDPSRAPIVYGKLVRGNLNDQLTLRGQYIKPGLQFDLFTVEHSSLAADGTPDPAFVNFGMAWYQSDVQADDHGRVRVSIQTILVDQIFGFDPAVSLPPTQTLEAGFWFNNPADAAACGFDPTKPTPFNGEHDAGPLAMISVPDANSGLGPLCTKPDTSVSPARCDP